MVSPNKPVRMEEARVAPTPKGHWDPGAYKPILEKAAAEGVGGPSGAFDRARGMRDALARMQKKASVR